MLVAEVAATAEVRCQCVIKASTIPSFLPLFLPSFQIFYFLSQIRFPTHRADGMVSLMGDVVWHFLGEKIKTP